MVNMINMYAYGRGYPRYGWPIPPGQYMNRLYYIYSGSAFFLKDDVEYHLKPGHIYIFPQNLPFYVRQKEDDPVDHLFFNFAIVPPFLFRNFIEIEINKHISIELSVAAIEYLVRQSRQNLGDRELAGLVQSYFENLIVLICREEKLEQLNDIRLLPVLEYIHDNYADKITCRDLAKMVSMEQNHFIRIFHREMLITPYQYLREYRVSNGISMIQTGMSIKETAVKVGYDNSSSFSKAVKKSRGYYPSHFTGKAFI